MKVDSKNKILNKIAAIRTKRAAAISATSIKSEDIYKAIEPNAVDCFKNELETVSGKCIICKNEIELIDNLKKILTEKKIELLFSKEKEIQKLLSNNNIIYSNKETDFKNMQAGISTCEFLIARTGSIIVSSTSESGRSMIIYPPIHIVLAKENQIVSYPEEAFNEIQLKYKNDLPSMFTTITGPSRTADIEKTLVLGAHGPKELIVLLLRS